MIKETLRHRTLPLLVTCVTLVAIVFMGMRVPDLSRPHRPKPIHRACIEKQAKPAHEAIKKIQQFLALIPAAVQAPVVIPYRAVDIEHFQSAGVSPQFPNLSRAPPLFLA